MKKSAIDRTDGAPLHEQVAAEIRRAIIDGEAGPGERLPPARDLAVVMGVNTNTVLKALRDLRDQGIVDFTRGRGVTVTGTPDSGVLRQRIAELVAESRRQGVRRSELLSMVKEAAS
jgi:GntR family transcriptional regulator